MFSFYALSTVTTLGAAPHSDVALRYEVIAHLGRPRVCRLRLDDPTGELVGAATPDAALGFAWVLDNTEIPLFAGTIADATPTSPTSLRLVGFDTFRLLQTRRLTTTLVNQSPAEMLRTLVGQELGLPTDEVEELDVDLDKLPLHRLTVVEAIDHIHRRLGLSHDYWVNEDGIFVWRARSYEQAEAADFVEGYDASDFDPAGKSLITWGTSAQLGQIVGLTDRQDVHHRLFVVGLRWYDEGHGARMQVFFEEAPQ